MLTDHVNMQMLGFANVGEINNEQALKGQMRAKRIEEGMQKEMLSLILNEEICRMNKEICTLKHPKATRGTGGEIHLKLGLVYENMERFWFLYS